METTKTKKKVNIDGKQQKVDHNVYLVLQNLTEALKQHEIALMTWVHKVYNEKKKHNEEEKMLHDYCMQIPDAAGILTRMKAIDEEVKSKGNNGSGDQSADGEGNSSSDS
tara:strand:- start:8707 stop:9036 length:330 start_codon:yes stop_codon:yes gene_type:complete